MPAQKLRQVQKTAPGLFMSDLFGNHIVGFLTRRLICCLALYRLLAPLFHRNTKVIFVQLIMLVK